MIQTLAKSPKLYTGASSFETGTLPSEQSELL